MCKDCVFSRLDHSVLVCARHAPQPLRVRGEEAWTNYAPQWPRVSPGWGCGEYAPKEGTDAR